MKVVLKIAGALVICVVLLLLTARVTGFEPGACPNPGDSWTCRVPGLWLRGNLVTTPVADWSFTDQYQNARLQTRDIFGFPHSIGTYMVAYNGQLYLTSFYAPGLPPYWHLGARQVFFRIRMLKDFPDFIGSRTLGRNPVYGSDQCAELAGRDVLAEIRPGRF